jgi:sugar lactone lactonase YvrE
VRKITPDGTVSTLAGSGSAGFADGVGAAAQLSYPGGFAVDGEGNIIITDSDNNRVRKISPDGTVSTLAGSGRQGFADGAGTAAQFNSPTGVAMDGEGSIIITDQGNHRVRKISPDGTVSTLAGSGSRGFVDGAGAAAQFNFPYGVAVDGEGSIIIADYGNQRVRKITPDGTVSTLAGSGSAGFADGAGAAAQFNGPYGVAVDGEGSIIITDYSNKRVRKITPDGTVSTLFAGSCGFYGVAIGADGCVVVCTNEHTVAKIAGCSVAAPGAGAQMQELASTLTSDYAALLDDDTSADVTFVVKSERITAHRNILAARCTYFRVMFSSGMREAQRGNDIVIQDTSPAAFRALLLYLYTDELAFDDTLLVDVLRKAKELELTRVYTHCERRCERELSTQKAVLWFVQADEYALEGLRESALRYLTRNFRTIRAEAPHTLAKLLEKPDLMAEVMMAV